jgi:hypothetical protein
VKGPSPLHHHTHQSEVHMHMYIEGMCATKAKNGFSKLAASTAVASAQEVRLTHRVGAPSRRCHRVGTPAPGRCRQLQLQRSTVRARGRAGSAPKQAAEAMPTSEERRGPQSGRAQEGQRAPTRKLLRSAGRECRAFTSAIRGLVLNAAAFLFCRSRAQEQ